MKKYKLPLYNTNMKGKVLNKTLISFILLFFCIGLVIDSFTYYSEGSQALLLLNMAGIVLFSANLVLKFKNYNYNAFDVLCFFYITINFIYTGYISIKHNSDVDYELIRIAFFCILLIISVSVLLPILWSYVIVATLSIGYIAAALFTSSDGLLENIIAIPFVFIAVSVWFRKYKQFIDSTIAKEIELKEENMRMAKTVNSDKTIINTYIEKLIRRSEKEGLSLDAEISELAKIVNYSLPSILTQHGEDMNTPEDDFYRNIVKAHSNLTLSEIKLAYMLLRDMSSKEIAKSTMRTTDSVRVLRYRLRKKMKLKKGINLSAYLKQFN